MRPGTIPPGRPGLSRPAREAGPGRRRRAPLRIGVLLAAILAAGAIGYVTMIRMPGRSHEGPLPSLSPREAGLRDDLVNSVEALSGGIGERNLPRYRSLLAAADLVERALREAGLEPRREGFLAEGRECSNLVAEIEGTGRKAEIVVVGAHYDSVPGSPGADDNATGTASLLALARAFAGKRPARTLRFVAFANEEMPYSGTVAMGSRVHGLGCRGRGENIVAMLSLETMGYYSTVPGSQRYPFPFGLLYPSTGDFIAFVGNVQSGSLVRQVVGCFRRTTAFPSEGGALPGFVPGVGWSDHASFWEQGYPGVMVTDTAPFRYPHYHTAEDTPEKIDFGRLARVVAGLERVVAELAEVGP
ncbi:MAG: M20/M25/M40 family metallo-hydrolase [Planctomycetes bacterium]|nr:M20/M25/M40 family metallo-hydrolase [Planctomycetota bacterium]